MLPKTIDARVRHAVTSCALSFPFGEAHLVRVCVCGLLCVPSFLKNSGEVEIVYVLAPVGRSSFSR